MNTGISVSDPEFAQVMHDFVNAAYSQGTLDTRDRELIAIVVLTSIQEYDELASYTARAISNHVDPIAIKEAIYQCAPFIGYPKVVSALRVINEEFKNQGIVLPLQGQKTIAPEERYAKGKQIQFPIYGDRIKAALGTLPQEQREKIPQWLTENCFGDFYTRTGLEIRTRELLILCIFCAIGDCEPQIKSHTLGNLKVGNSKEVIASAMTQCIPFIGFSRVINALRIIKDIEAP